MLISTVLTDGRVRLEPLGDAHVEPLWRLASAEPELFRFMTFDDSDRAALVARVAGANAEAARGEGVTFAVLDAESGAALGSTALMDFSGPHRRVEIGRSWLGAPARGSGVNLAVKRLLLSFAFDTLGLNRVQLKADARNARSRRAIERLGVPFEGILRAHMVLPDGFVRDSALYALTRADWTSGGRVLSGGQGDGVRQG